MNVQPAEPDQGECGRLAAVLALVWALGTAAGHWIGLWWSVAGTALLLGSIAVAARGRLLRRLLAPSRARILRGLAAGGVMIASTYALYPVASRLFPGLAERTAELYALMGGVPAPVCIGLLPLIIVGEELVWRGVFQEAAARRAGALPAVAAAAFTYALAHAPAGNTLLVLLALVCGLYWSALRAATGSLLVPLLAHLVWDGCVFLLAPLASIAHPR